MITNSVKVPASRPYQESLLQSLQNPEEAASYLLVALQDSAAEPELLSAVLQDVEAALGSSNENISEIVMLPMNQAMPRLIDWLDNLGFQITISPKS